MYSVVSKDCLGEQKSTFGKFSVPPGDGVHVEFVGIFGTGFPDGILF